MCFGVPINCNGYLTVKLQTSFNRKFYVFIISRDIAFATCINVQMTHKHLSFSLLISLFNDRV